MRKNNEFGLTLVEILAYLVLTSIMCLFAFSIINSSLEVNRKVTIEASVRDEADLIMSNLMKTIYSLKESEVEKVVISPDGSTALIFTSKKKDACANPSTEDYKRYCMITGFNTVTKDSKQYRELIINSKEYKINNKFISLDSDSIIQISQSKNSKVSYKIFLSLKYDNGKFKKTYYFENEIQSIQDIK